jgi:hypothetical protein
MNPEYAEYNDEKRKFTAETAFIFAIIWGMGSAVTTRHRSEFSQHFVEVLQKYRYLPNFSHFT